MRQPFRNRKERARRQAEAQVRQAAYDQLTTVQRFNLPGRGERESNKLLGVLNADTERRLNEGLMP